MSSKVLVILPKFGLGNMLLVWAKGLAFAKRNNFDFNCIGWTKIHWGAILRKENRKRWYSGYFKRNGLMTLLLLSKDYIIKEKHFNSQLSDRISKEKALFVFNKLETNIEMFKELRPFEEEIRTGLLALLNSKNRMALQHLEAPEIAVHVRRGDFKLSHLATPIEYFIEVINTIRQANGWDIPVKVFTDASLNEIAPLMALSSVKLAQADADILDILWMSKSKMIILSPSSSFSYWAAFLSNATVILKESDWQVKIKENSDTYKEVRYPESVVSDELLLQLVIHKNKHSST